ncbi:MAG: response regulator [Candidatus Delongbacteria bacterium]|nr:response regulator [Candidatus Delongbacteria bacterium]
MGDQFHHEVLQFALKKKSYSFIMSRVMDDSERFYEAKLNWVINENILYIVSIIRDISEQKTAQLGLEKNYQELKRLNDELTEAMKRAEESDRLKTAFLQNLSHEIRTPMNGIIGFAHLLNQSKIGDDKKQYYLQMIFDNSRQLMTILNDTITISRIDTGQEQLEYESVDLIRLLNRVIGEYASQAFQKGVQLRLIRERSLQDLMIMTDSAKLFQILANLLDNAIKFSSRGTVSLSFELHENDLLFSVRDQGQGIDPAMYEIIFERFRQADIDIKSTHGGLGLGLSICKAYIGMMGGHIWLESELGSGSVFYFTLPCRKPFAADSGNPLEIITLSTQSSRREPLILIAEDEEINYLYFNELLENNGYHTLHARNGCEALEILKAKPDISLILMDVKMPLMDGMEATRAIRKENSQIPIIALTAYALEGERKRLLSMGFNEYLSKPVDDYILIETLKRFLWID